MHPYTTSTAHILIAITCHMTPFTPLIAPLDVIEVNPQIKLAAHLYNDLLSLSSPRCPDNNNAEEACGFTCRI
jgi:hypothetical protein